MSNSDHNKNIPAQQDQARRDLARHRTRAKSIRTDPHDAADSESATVRAAHRIDQLAIATADTTAAIAAITDTITQLRAASFTSRHRSVAITHLEDAALRLAADLAIPVVF